MKSHCWQGAFKYYHWRWQAISPLSPSCHMLLPIFAPFIFGLWEMWASSYITNRKFWITNRSGHGLAKSLRLVTPLHPITEMWMMNSLLIPGWSKAHSLGYLNPERLQEGPLCYYLWPLFMYVCIMWPFKNYLRFMSAQIQRTTMIDKWDNKFSAN